MTIHLMISVPPSSAGKSIVKPQSPWRLQSRLLLESEAALVVGFVILGNLIERRVGADTDSPPGRVFGHRHLDRAGFLEGLARLEPVADGYIGQRHIGALADERHIEGARCTLADVAH